MEFFELIEKRKSIRRYKPDLVPDDSILKVLEAARLAPSGGNRQPWHFIVVKDKETKRELAGDREWATGAPAIIVGLVNRRIQESYYYNDRGIAFEHLVLAAADMSLMRRNEEAKQLLEV